VAIKSQSQQRFGDGAVRSEKESGTAHVQGHGEVLDGTVCLYMGWVLYDIWRAAIGGIASIQVVVALVTGSGGRGDSEVLLYPGEGGRRGEARQGKR